MTSAPVFILSRPATRRQRGAARSPPRAIRAGSPVRGCTTSCEELPEVLISEVPELAPLRSATLFGEDGRV